uniref:Uncharacterized protein n=1 Tax=Arundo donax TaxID=35708 RepID=A0A0A9D567_ARUDO
MAVTLVALLFTTVAVPLLSQLLLLSSTTKPLLRHGDGRRLPPSPPGLPFLGHLHLLGSLPHQSLRSLAVSHGPVMLLRLGPVPTVVVSSAAATEEALKTHDVPFSGRPRLLMVGYLLYGCDMALGPYGKYWRQARRICVLHLFSSCSIIAFGRVREQVVTELVGRIRAAAGSGTVNLSHILICYNNSIVSRATFGDGEYRLDGDVGGEKLREVLADFLELIATLPMWEIAPWLGWVDR